MISPAKTSVLLALVACHREGRATVRSVAMRCGRNVSTTHLLLCRLRELGLVTWDDEKQGTLRPLVKVVSHGVAS